MRVLLDSSFILAFLLEEQHTSPTEPIFKDIFSGVSRGYIIELIIAEVCGAAARRVGKETARKVLSLLREWISKGILTVIPQTPEICSNAFEWCILYGIKGADALIASSAKAEHCRLATHDRNLTERIPPTLRLSSD